MTKRAVIQDLNDPNMPVITEMIITGVTSPGGNLLNFSHPDRTHSIIHMAPGWNLSVYVDEEE